MLGKTIGINSVILGAFAAATAGLIALTFQSTHARIEQAERAAQQKALFEIVPRAQHTNDLLKDLIVMSPTETAALGLGHTSAIHVARSGNEPVAYIFPAVAPDGYSGDISMIVGVTAQGKVAGVRVLSHRETPGLGDRVELSKSDWILGFDGKSLQNPSPAAWTVKKDGGEFDAFTGATITPRAVIKKVKEVLMYYDANRAELEHAAQASEASDE